MQSTLVWSLNHVVTPSLGVGPNHNIPGAPIPSTAYQGGKILSIYMIWMSDAVHSGFEP